MIKWSKQNNNTIKQLDQLLFTVSLNNFSFEKSRELYLDEYNKQQKKKGNPFTHLISNFIKEYRSELLEKESYTNYTNSSAIIMFGTYYEEYIKAILRHHISENPSDVHGSKKITMTVDELLNLDKKKIIESKVEEELNKLNIGYFILLHQALKYLNIYKDNAKKLHGWKNEIKLFSIYRNCIAHSSGIVDEIAITTLRDINNNEYNIGDKIIISSEYLSNLHRLIKSIVTLLDEEFIKKYNDQIFQVTDIKFYDLSKENFDTL